MISLALALVLTLSLVLVLVFPLTACIGLVPGRGLGRNSRRAAFLPSGKSASRTWRYSARSRLYVSCRRFRSHSRSCICPRLRWSNSLTPARSRASRYSLFASSVMSQSRTSAFTARPLRDGRCGVLRRVHGFPCQTDRQSSRR